MKEFFNRNSQELTQPGQRTVAQYLGLRNDDFTKRERAYIASITSNIIIQRDHSVV